MEYIGNERCKRNHCKTCNYIKETDTFRSTHTGKSYRVNASATCTCKTECVVYLIKCKDCRVQYVGMTRRPLCKRFNEHRANIRHEKKKKEKEKEKEKKKEKRTSYKKQSLAEHFTEHSIEYIMIIEQVDDVKTLSKRERYWIDKLGTKTHGLNRR